MRYHTYVAGLFVAGVCALCLAGPAFAAAPAPKHAAPARAAAPGTDEAKEQLDVAARTHLERVIRTLRPSMEHKAIVRQGGAVRVSYMVVDTGSLRTELVSQQTPGSLYVGNVIYVVHEYESIGRSEQEALGGTFRKTKSRRVREFTCYENGRWQL